MLVSILGAVLAVAGPQFLRKLRTSKVAEASEELELLHRGAAMYYATWHAQAAHGTKDHCLPSAAGPTPAQPSVDPVEVTFTDDATPGAPTWQALRFEPESGVRYSYSFLPIQSGCGVTTRQDGAPLVTIRAEGDLDGDGTRSRFERYASPNAEGEIVQVEALVVSDRIE